MDCHFQGKETVFPATMSVLGRHAVDANAMRRLEIEFVTAAGSVRPGRPALGRCNRWEASGGSLERRLLGSSW
jgi:hypothetical protein